MTRAAVCVCRCRCGRDQQSDMDGLCAVCWRAWSKASEKHQPIADRSYLGVYGLTNPWAPWVMNRASHLLAKRAKDWRVAEVAPRCPNAMCGMTMVRRPGAWKCYHHDPPIETPEALELPRSPVANVVKVPR